MAGHFNEEVQSRTIAEGTKISITDGRLIDIGENSFVVLVINLEIVGLLSPSYVQARCLRDQGERVNFIEMPFEQLRDILRVDQSRARATEGLLSVILAKASNESVDLRQERQAAQTSTSAARAIIPTPASTSSFVPHPQAPLVGLETNCSIRNALSIKNKSEDYTITAKLIIGGKVIKDPKHYAFQLMDEEDGNSIIEARTKNELAFDFCNELERGAIYKVGNFKVAASTDKVTHIWLRDHLLSFETITADNFRRVTDAPAQLKRLQLPLVDLNGYTEHFKANWYVRFAIISFTAVALEVVNAAFEKRIRVKGSAATAKEIWIILYHEHRNNDVQEGIKYVFQSLKITSIPTLTSTAATRIETPEVYEARRVNEEAN